MNNPSHRPTGVVIFLFTDIEGSTRLAQLYPDQWEALRDRHHAILKSAIESQNGYVFQIIGDAFCATFQTASGALCAAVKSQIDLHQESWGDALVKVRMGIHAGPAEIQQGGDYRGFLTMSRVQRLMSAAHGGQVLISLAAHELVYGDLPEDVSLRDMGERRLKDLIHPEHIFQLVIANLPSDFPPLKTLDVYRHNLPAQTTSFIGREKEMAEIKQAIDERRLVTLTGSGGTGKTRLSMQVAADRLDQFPDGIWFIELAPLANPDLIPQTILSAFGMSEAQGKTPLQTLLDHVRDKNLLLILDNCEHLIEACAQLADALLSHSPALKILASSREVLGVKGEMAWRILSLSTPDAKHLSDVDLLSNNESVRLFLERATLAHPRFQMTKDNISSIARICSRLDGIPLAIELAAARVRALSVEQIAERLDDRFLLLTGGSRTALPRQQTLRALIDWSYQLLSDDERLLFRRLAVFVGGWTLDAAESVCRVSISIEGRGVRGEGFDVLELTTRLVDKSLINVEHRAGESRYRRLETIRQYAREKLFDTAEVASLRDLHLAYFVGLAERAEHGLQGRVQKQWLARLEDEHDNLRAALEWSLKAQPETGLRMAAALMEFWDTHGHITEAHRWVESLLNATSHLPPTATRVKALYGSAGLVARQSDLALAQARLDEGLALAQNLDDKAGIAQGLSYRGFFKEFLENDLDMAESLLNQALEIWRGLGDKFRIGQALGPLASCAIKRHDYARAASLFKESLALFREVENEKEIAGALWNLSEVALLRRDYNSVRTLAEESLARYRELDDRHGTATALRALSVALHNQGNLDQAQTASEHSVAIFREMGDRDCMAISLSVLARQIYQRNELQRAAALIRESVTIFHEEGYKAEEARALDVAGRVALAQGDLPRAQKSFQVGISCVKDANEVIQLPSLLEGLVNALARSAQIQRAILLLGAAEALREQIHLTRMQFEIAEYDALISGLREQADDSMFEKAWNNGRAMTTEQAIALALN